MPEDIQRNGGVDAEAKEIKVGGDVVGRDKIAITPSGSQSNPNITLAIVAVVALALVVVVGLFVVVPLLRSPVADNMNSGDPQLSPQLSPTHAQQNASPLLSEDDVSVGIQPPTIWSPRPDGGWEVQWFFKLQNHADHEVRLSYDTGNFVVKDSFGQLRSTPGQFGCTSQDIVLKPNEIFTPADGCRVILENDGKVDEIEFAVHSIAGVQDRDWKFRPPF
jgi:hypothetical protein